MWAIRTAFVAARRSGEQGLNRPLRPKRAGEGDIVDTFCSSELSRGIQALKEDAAPERIPLGVALRDIQSGRMVRAKAHARGLERYADCLSQAISRCSRD